MLFQQSICTNRVHYNYATIQLVDKKYSGIDFCTHNVYNSVKGVFYMLRINELRAEMGLSMRQVAIKLGIPYTTYISYEKGDREPNSEMLIKLADFFECSIDYLIGRSSIRINDSVLDKVLELDSDLLELTGNIVEAQKLQKERDSNLSIEELFTETVSRNEIEHIVKYRTLDRYGKKAVDDLLETEYQRCTEIIDEPNVISLPMAELKASAGTGQWLGDDEYTTRVDVLDTPEARRANVVIEVSGDSMEPQYHDGDKVLVKLQPTIEQNEIGIFIVDNCGYIKKLGVNELISVNNEYDNIPLNEYNDVICVGKVIGIAEII